LGGVGGARYEKSEQMVLICGTQALEKECSYSSTRMFSFLRNTKVYISSVHHTSPPGSKNSALSVDAWVRRRFQRGPDFLIFENTLSAAYGVPHSSVLPHVPAIGPISPHHLISHLPSHLPSPISHLPSSHHLISHPPSPTLTLPSPPLPSPPPPTPASPPHHHRSTLTPPPPPPKTPHLALKTQTPSSFTYSLTHSLQLIIHTYIHIYTIL